MTSIRLPAVVLFALLVAACTGRGGGGTATLGDYVETDFATAPPELYSEAARDISLIVGRELSDLPGARSYGPHDVLALPGGHLLVAIEPEEGGESLILALSSGASLVWSEAIPLAEGTMLKAAGLSQRAGAPVLSVDLAGGVADVLHLVITGAGPVALRAEAEGQVVNHAFLAANPAVPTARGRLGGDDLLPQLMATMHLARGDQAGERGQQAVQGHLRALAGSNDTWLAQAAANLLTLPTR